MIQRMSGVVRFGCRGGTGHQLSLLVLTIVLFTCPVAAQEGAVRFAVIGDFGSTGRPESDVANLVKSWNPDFIITLGDNNYEVAGVTGGLPATIDINIGQYYHEFISPYRGAFGQGAAVNRFFPTIGNHDYETATGYNAYLNYFTLPNNERYYDFVRGPVHLLTVNSDIYEPDGVTETSPQANWLRGKLQDSTSVWKLVYFHHPPYSSTSETHIIGKWMRWPFQEWGASVVMSGHVHNYERLYVGGIPYIINGLGGRGGFPEFGAPISGSLVRYKNDFGAMLVDADSSVMTCRFISRAGVLVDKFTLAAPPPSISGRVVDTTDSPVANVSLSLKGSKTQVTQTDAYGRYSFSGLDVGGGYTVTPSGTNYNFSPKAMAVTALLSNHQLNFTAASVTGVFSAAVPALRACAPGSMARAFASLGDEPITLTYADRSGATGGFPTKLRGVQVFVNNSPAQIITVKNEEGADGLHFVDFVLPDVTPHGANVPVRITRDDPSGMAQVVAQLEAVVSATAPALWTAVNHEPGFAPTQNALSFVAGGSTDVYSVIDPNLLNSTGLFTRVALYGTGMRGAPDTVSSNNRPGLTNVAESYTATAGLADGSQYELTVEYVGAQGFLSGLDMVVVRLRSELTGAGVVTLRVIEKGSGREANPIKIRVQ